MPESREYEQRSTVAKACRGLLMAWSTHSKQLPCRSLLLSSVVLSLLESTWWEYSRAARHHVCSWPAKTACKALRRLTGPSKQFIALAQPFLDGLVGFVLGPADKADGALSKSTRRYESAHGCQNV